MPRMTYFRCENLFLLLTLFLRLSTGVSGMNFTCERPTTRCDTWYGQCQPDGHCACSNGAFGLQCQIPGSAKLNAGTCLMHNPCVNAASGNCYDDGITAKCDCMEGYYGNGCQHRMAQAECDATKMVLNVLPYGFAGDSPWSTAPPLIMRGENFTCALDPMSLFLTNHPEYQTRGWSGFAGTMLHSGDPVCGYPTVLADNPATTTYSRRIYISYASSAAHPTDQMLDLICDVRKAVAAPLTPALPGPKVSIYILTEQGQPAVSPLPSGVKVHVHFQLNFPNSGGSDDVQVDSCMVRDKISQQNVVVVDRACAQSPMGELLYKKGQGVAVLIMTVWKLPGMSGRLSFDCRVRTCNKLVDNYCSTPANCSMRGRRSVKTSSESANNVMHAVMEFTVRDNDL